MAACLTMKTDKPLRLLIADPDGKRLAMLLNDASLRPEIRACGAATTAEVYRQCEAFLPECIALASEFARMNSFQEMSDLFGMIGAKVVVFDTDARGLIDSVLPSRSPRPAAPRRPVPPPAAPTPTRPVSIPDKRPDIVAIGASTGGIPAIEKILLSFPADCPPTLIVQHIHAGFAEGLARRLDGMVRPQVIAGEDGMELRAGQICIAACSNRHLTAVSRAGLRIKLVDGPAISGHKPSVDALFQSLAALADRFRISASLLSGMGSDGADGMASLRRNGAFTIAQDKDSSVVWGMPQAAIARDGADVVLPIEQIAAALLGCRVGAPRAEHVAR